MIATSDPSVTRSLPKSLKNREFQKSKHRTAHLYDWRSGLDQTILPNRAKLGIAPVELERGRVEVKRHIPRRERSPVHFDRVGFQRSALALHRPLAE
jgi:hypothetical protein